MKGDIFGNHPDAIDRFTEELKHGKHMPEQFSTISVPVSPELEVEAHNVVVATTLDKIAVAVDGNVIVDSDPRHLTEQQAIRLLEAVGLDFIAELLTDQTTETEC
jgi:uncharacterized protein (DUF2249 family)